MKNILLLVFSLFTSTLITAQTTVEIIANDTKKPIDFATILLPDYKKSFVANEKGIFNVDVSTYKLPLKIIIDHYGYEKKEVLLNSHSSTVYLDVQSEILQEIIIPPTNAKIKERTYGRKNEGSGRIQGQITRIDDTNKNSGIQFGMIINTNENLKKIKKIHWHINKITFIKAVINLQFYEVENGKPSKHIPHSEINFTITENQKGWLVINVENKDIYIDGSKKIAAILKVQKVAIKKGDDSGNIIMNVGGTATNFLALRSNIYDEWETGPMNYPFYITVDSYE